MQIEKTSKLRMPMRTLQTQLNHDEKCDANKRTCCKYSQHDQIKKRTASSRTRDLLQGDTRVVDTQGILVSPVLPPQVKFSPCFNIVMT